MAFRQAMDDYDLTDLRRDGRHNIQERLDRFLVDQSWRDSLLHYKVDYLGFHSSDHRLILLTFNSDSRPQYGSGRGFKFEPFWLREEDLGGIIGDAWSEKGPSQIVKDLKSKLNWCAGKLLGWSQERFGSLRRLIGEKQKRIESLYNRCGEKGVMALIKKLENEVEGLLASEEIYWKQRSRADWLAAVNRNSKFFHARASARKNKNFISCLVDKDGIVQESEEGLSQVVCDFSNLFPSSNPSDQDIRKATDPIGSRLSPEIQAEMSTAFSVDEIKDRVFDMGPTKAPGLDGFQAIFF
ncbi:hypothetical protein Dsin_023185 [Dipteronia sinensis]|uniref:Reverse transcriptase n=1 Tax=Dipteronia sinensis TaxID=43782 RepID=A0AAE0A2X0_9ROSI|nr:hypothetical protein Dsin_023185 [Dipteronia sinensis]